MILFKSKIKAKPLDTEFYLNANEIIVPTDFLTSPPHFSKYRQYRNQTEKSRKIDKAIVVKEINHKYVIADCYIRYLLCRDYGIDKIPCRLIGKGDS